MDINKINDGLLECKKGNHKLKVIFQESSLNDAEATVRWCETCGSVTVDADRDNRTYPGRIMKMVGPGLYQPFRNNKVVAEREEKKDRIKVYAQAEYISVERGPGFWAVNVKIGDRVLSVTPSESFMDDEEKAKEVAREINKDILEHTKFMHEYIKDMDRERHKYDPNYRG